MPDEVISIKHLEAAAKVIGEFISPAPLIRSYRLEKELGLPSSRRVWIKDYAWTPVETLPYGRGSDKNSLVDRTLH